ncbi:MAG: hypothetical protein OEZ23_07800, partial [Gammaproteobacteria bacterium]|nr:hypothetical protein [Gammaproteobacteria bacterium]
MSFLDELKRKTEQQLVLERAARQRAEKLDEIYRFRILPVMEKIYTYLHEMCQHLNYINTDTIVSYTLEGVGELDHLRQEDYNVKADSRENMKEVVFSFSCKDEGNVTVSVDSKSELEKLEQYLFEHHLKFQLKTLKDEKSSVIGGQFTIQKNVPVAIKFKVDVDKSVINVVLVNLEQLVRREIEFSPESITDNFL